MEVQFSCHSDDEARISRRRRRRWRRRRFATDGSKLIFWKNRYLTTFRRHRIAEQLLTWREFGSELEDKRHKQLHTRDGKKDITKLLWCREGDVYHRGSVCALNQQPRVQISTLYNFQMIFCVSCFERVTIRQRTKVLEPEKITVQTLWKMKTFKFCSAKYVNQIVLN